MLEQTDSHLRGVTLLCWIPRTPQGSQPLYPLAPGPEGPQQGWALPTSSLRCWADLLWARRWLLSVSSAGKVVWSFDVVTHRTGLFHEATIGTYSLQVRSKCPFRMEKKKKKKRTDPFEFHLLEFITVLLIIANRQCELQLANCLLTFRSNNSHVPELYKLGDCCCSLATGNNK